MKFNKRLNNMIAIILCAMTYLAHAQTAQPNLNTPVSTQNNQRISETRYLTVPPFDFDWQSHRTIAPSFMQIQAAEAFVQSISPTSTLAASDDALLGKLLYKMGSFYAHVKRDPSAAISKLNAASQHLQQTEDQAWVNNQLAYAYELQYVHSKQQHDRDMTIALTHKVITTLYPHTINTAVAFAYGVEGLLLRDEKKYPESAARLQQAFDYYRQQGLYNDTSNRAKSRLAHVLIKLHRHDPSVLLMLQEVKQYWIDQGDMGQIPYAANHLVALGQVYMSQKKYRAARNEFDTALSIYKNIYGAQHPILVLPYHYLAQAYRLDDKEKLADIYEEEAMRLTIPSKTTIKAAS